MIVAAVGSAAVLLALERSHRGVRFHRTLDPASGLPVRWTGGTIRLVLFTEGIARRHRDGAHHAVSAAVGRWSDASRSCSGPALALEVAHGGAPVAEDGTNAIVLRRRHWCRSSGKEVAQCWPRELAAVTTIYPGPGTRFAPIREADIAINAVD